MQLGAAVGVLDSLVPRLTNDAVLLLPAVQAYQTLGQTNQARQYLAVLIPLLAGSIKDKRHAQAFETVSA